MSDPKPIVVRVSVDIQRNTYGPSMGYQSISFEVGYKTPVVSREIGEAARKAFESLLMQPYVEKAYEAAMTAPVPDDVASPEMPGPGYDAQTRPVKP